MKTWLVDIDGTLAVKGERGPFDWHRVGEDTPNAPEDAAKAPQCRWTRTGGRWERGCAR